MKKHLIALAALAATGAFAQSSVTVYGVADVAYKTNTWTTAGTEVAKTAGISDGAVAGQRIGFKGTEDMGGGLKANFVIEQGLSMTSAGLTNYRTATSAPQVDSSYSPTGRSSTSLNRQSWVGLSGGFGELRLGYQYTNLYELSTLSGFNIGSEGTHGADTAHTYGNAAIGGTRANGVTYITPNFGGFTVALQRGAGTGQESASSTANSTTAGSQVNYENSRTGLMLSYNQGPLKVMLAHTQYVNGSASSGVSTSAGSITTITGRGTQLGASYDFGAASVAATMNNVDDGAAVATTYKSQQIGVRVPFGKAAFLATTGSAKADKAGAATEDVTQTQFALQYSLSKRTMAYAYMGETKDATTGLATSGTITTAEKKASTVIGISHSF